MSTFTFYDPELARMFENAAPTAKDIPRFVELGRTPAGQARQISIKFASIADVSAHLDHQGRRVRAAYLSILALTAIRDQVLVHAGGDPQAPFLATLNAHAAPDEQVEP